MKLPVIPSCQSLQDLITMANNMRNWFKGLSDSGGLVSVNDLISGKVVPKISKTAMGTDSISITPPGITGLTVTGAFRTIMLSWTGVSMNMDYFAYYEIWRSTTDDIGAAVLIGDTVATIYVDEPPNASLSQVYYYWVRAVSTSGQEGPYNAIHGVSGGTASDPVYLIEVLSAELAKVTPTLNVPDLVYACNRFALKMGTGDSAVYPFVVAQIPGSSPAQYAVFMDTAFIKDATITNAKIQSLATDKLTAGSALIGSALIADAAITEAKIGNAQITNLKLGNYISSDNFDGSVTYPYTYPGTAGWCISKSTGDAAFNNIRARGDIQASSLQSNTAMVNTANIVNGAITTAKIGDAQITTAKIGSAQVDTLQIAGSAVTAMSSSGLDSRLLDYVPANYWRVGHGGTSISTGTYGGPVEVTVTGQILGLSQNVGSRVLLSICWSTNGTPDTGQRLNEYNFPWTSNDMTYVLGFFTLQSVHVLPLSTPGTYYYWLVAGIDSGSHLTIQNVVVSAVMVKR